MKVTFEIKAPKGTKTKEVKRIVEMLLDIGFADASATLDTPDMSDDPDALLAVRLKVGRIVVED